MIDLTSIWWKISYIKNVFQLYNLISSFIRVCCQWKHIHLHSNIMMIRKIYLYYFKLVSSDLLFDRNIVLSSNCRVLSSLSVTKSLNSIKYIANKMLCMLKLHQYQCSFFHLYKSIAIKMYHCWRRGVIIL